MKKLLHALYSLVPFKKPLLLFLKKMGTPPQWLYRHLHFKGKFNVNISPGKSFQLIHYGFEIENELFWKGFQDGWEKVSLGLWVQLCKNSDIIFDIGANTGIYAMVANTINGKAEVFAFEPVERVYDKLVKNCELNKFNTTCYQKAVSNFTGKAVIFDTEEVHVLSVTVNKNLNAPSTPVKEYEIETITLKQVIEDNKLPRIDLMKIDVETHEPEVLEGMGEYLKKFQPTMLIEILNDEVGQRISQLISGIDYLYFNIDEDNGIRRVDTITHSDYYNYLLCSKEIATELNLL